MYWKMSRTGTRKQKISPLKHGKYSSDDLRWFCLIFTEFTRRMQADNTRLANVESWTRGQVWGRSAYLEKHCKRARTADDGGVARPTGSRGVPAAIKWGQKAQDFTINTKTQKFTTEIKLHSKSHRNILKIDVSGFQRRLTVALSASDWDLNKGEAGKK